MNVELDKQDLIRLVKGTSNEIGYELMDYLKPIGKLTGFPNEKWYWDEQALKSMTERQLYIVYKKITNK